MNQTLSLQRRCFELFLISSAVLFLELAAIRWFPAYVLSVTFFTNFVLLAAFVGMSIGCLAANRPWTVLHYFPALMAVSCGAALAVYLTTGWLFWATVEVAGNSQNPELVYFGTERGAAAAEKQVIPVDLLLSVLFVLIALWFVGLGQVLGRKLAAVERRVLAYTVNIGGSLAGIALFAVFALLELPPVWWFGAAVLCVIYFLRETRRATLLNLTLLAGTLGVIGLAGWMVPGFVFYWSPYYAIRYSPQNREITVNGIGHQVMLETERSVSYALPYLMRRDAGLPPIRDVLVIGAGSGNDVAHALRQGVERVDAVEIDPAIARLGRRDHPNRPYDDPRVRLIVDDGRAFLRKSDRKYDLIVYALVDSLTLHSSYSSIRLENFLFTEQAVQDVAARLKPGGLFVAYNFYRQGWIVARLHEMMKNTFGHEPVLLSLPNRDVIRDTESEGPHMALLLAGAADAVDPIRNKLDADAFKMYPSELTRQVARNGFSQVAMPDETRFEVWRLRPAWLEQSRTWKLPSDDWPFLYLREPRIPAHNWRGIALMLGLSLGLLLVFSPKRSLQIHPHFFFLGAGFMLIETRSVTQAAQLFGSSWQVNSVVFAGILLMILLANLFVLKVGPRRLWPFYLGLAAALALCWSVPMTWFAGHALALRICEYCAVQFLPILFAGVLFASSFDRCADPAQAFGANIAGVVLGGLLEYSSLVIGYQALLLVAAVLYALSMFGARLRSQPAAL